MRLSNRPWPAIRRRDRCTSACGRPVEVQNLAVGGYRPLQVYHRLDAALALEPDLVMMGLVPFELERPMSPAELAQRDHPRPIAPARGG